MVYHSVPLPDAHDQRLYDRCGKHGVDTMAATRLRRHNVS